MKITMDDVARESGVSKATVSYVLNNRQSTFGISAKTAAKVLDTVKRLNYKVDQAAVLLSEKKNDIASILLLTPWLHAQFSDFMVRVSAAVEEMCRTHKLKISYEMYRNVEFRKVLRGSKCKKFDAVLVMGSNEDSESYCIRNHEKFHNVVFLNRNVNGFPCVYGDDEDAAFRLASKVAARNYYDRYLVVTHPEMSRLERMRTIGYLEGLKSAAGSEQIVRMELPRSILSPDAEYLWTTLHGRRTACFLSQYQPAAELLAQALRHGIVVPSEVGIAAYDRHSMIEPLLAKELTTTDSHLEEMTREAIRICLELKNGEHPQSRQVLSETISGNSMVM